MLKIVLICWFLKNICLLDDMNSWVSPKKSLATVGLISICWVVLSNRSHLTVNISYMFKNISDKWSYLQKRFKHTSNEKIYADSGLCSKLVANILRKSVTSPKKVFGNAFMNLLTSLVMFSINFSSCGNCSRIFFSVGHIKWNMVSSGEAIAVYCYSAIEYLGSNGS